MLQRPRRLVLVADPTHCAVEHDPVVRPAAAPEGYQKNDRSAEGLAVEERRQRRRVASAEGVEEGDAVVDDGADVGDVVGEAVGEAVALVVDGARGESRFGEEDGGQLEEPAGLAGVAVDDGDGAEDFGRGKWGPGLGEEFHAPRVCDVLGGVSH